MIFRAFLILGALLPTATVLAQSAVRVVGPESSPVTERASLRPSRDKAVRRVAYEDTAELPPAPAATPDADPPSRGSGFRHTGPMTKDPAAANWGNLERP